MTYVSLSLFPYKNARSAAILAALQNDSAQLSDKTERPAKLNNAETALGNIDKTIL
jgi:hypothetical protein